MSMLSLLALGVGLALGTVGHATGWAAFEVVAKAVEPLGAFWLAALQMALLPLVFTQLLSAIVGSRAEGGASMGGLGLRAIVLFVFLLAAAGILTAILTPPLLTFYKVDPQMVESLAHVGNLPNLPKVEAKSGDWTKSLPTNLIESARKGEVLPILIFAGLLGAAMHRLRDEQRLPITNVVRGLAEAMMTIVRWLLLGAPVGIFALTYVSALRAGGGTAGMMGAFILLVCILLAIFLIALYPITALTSRTSLRQFARAAAPAQLVAISTLSSLASLPALVQGGVDHLRLPSRVSGFVLPLSVSLFKLNRPVSSMAKLFFLAYVYHVPLGIGTIGVFLVSVILLSFGTVGVPQGGQAFTTLPAYLAAGIPVQGVILLEATAIAPDMLKTLVNVTADMSVAAFLSRDSRVEARSTDEETVAEMASEGAR